MTHVQYSLLTGSIPRGYGPLKTPVTFGSRVRKRFPLRSSVLLGTNKATSVLNVKPIHRKHLSLISLNTYNKLFVTFLSPKKILHMHPCACLAGFTTLMNPSHREILTSTSPLWTWPSHSTQNQRCSGTLRSSRCISGPCRWRTGPSSGWYNGPQRMCSRSAHTHSITPSHAVGHTPSLPCLNE